MNIVKGRKYISLAGDIILANETTKLSLFAGTTIESRDVEELGTYRTDRLVEFYEEFDSEKLLLPVREAIANRKFDEAENLISELGLRYGYIFSFQVSLTGLSARVTRYKLLEGY